MRNLIMAITATGLLGATPVFAAETEKIYNSGLLVLMFVGFCALLIVVQLIPALLSVLGLTKSAATQGAENQARLEENRKS